MASAVPELESVPEEATTFRSPHGQTLSGTQAGLLGGDVLRTVTPRVLTDSRFQTARQRFVAGQFAQTTVRPGSLDELQGVSNGVAVNSRFRSNPGADPTLTNAEVLYNLENRAVLSRQENIAAFSQASVLLAQGNQGETREVTMDRNAGGPGNSLFMNQRTIPGPIRPYFQSLDTRQSEAEQLSSRLDLPNFYSRFNAARGEAIGELVAATGDNINFDDPEQQFYLTQAAYGRLIRNQKDELDSARNSGGFNPTEELAALQAELERLEDQLMIIQDARAGDMEDNADGGEEGEN